MKLYSFSPPSLPSLSPLPPLPSLLSPPPPLSPHLSPSSSQICKYDIEQSISREMSGDLKTSMLTVGECLPAITIHIKQMISLILLHVVKCVRNKSAYFAERLYKSMKVLERFSPSLPPPPPSLPLSRTLKLWIKALKYYID